MARFRGSQRHELPPSYPPSEVSRDTEPEAVETAARPPLFDPFVASKGLFCRIYDDFKDDLRPFEAGKDPEMLNDS